ncbi:polysaccharide deacetylase family protein [Thalassotalea euphylliae]|nr:polysaccharide deacetylase family protein [Thalassotalea euphylliae]
MEKQYLKLAVYTGDIYSHSTVKPIYHIAKHFPDSKIKVFVNVPHVPFRKVIKAQIKNLKLNGFFRVLEISGILWERGTNKLVELFTSNRKQSNGRLIDYFQEVFESPNIEIEFIRNINELGPSLISEFSPDIGLSIAAPILTESVLSIATLGNLNVHKGMLPKYRGMPPAFWEIYHGEKVVGCTIHEMTAELDGGNILLEEEIPTHKWSTPKGLQVQLDEMATKMYPEAISMYLAGHKGKEQFGEKNTFTKPSLKAYRQLINKQSANLNIHKLKYIIKQLVLISILIPYGKLIALYRGLTGKQITTVLLYHRVNDFQRDNLTVGVEQFNCQMEYISKSLNVIGIEDLQANKVDRFSLKPNVAITFDDGYLDNFLNAFPICQKNKVCASFYVSTEMVDKGKPFPHDQKHNLIFANMTWDNLKEMKLAGMHIGSHTMNHVRSSTTQPCELKREFSYSKMVLEQQLNEPVDSLAYPFGGKSDFNKECLELAKEAGYKTVLSAYGGVNRQLDLFNIKRKGIDWTFSHWAFVSQIYDWK